MLLALLLQIAEPQHAYSEVREFSHADMDAKLRACGFQHFTITFEKSFQSDTAQLRDTQVTDDQLRCAFQAQHPSGYLLFWSEMRVQERFYEISHELTEPSRQSAALSYFASRPGLGPLPERKARQSDLNFAREIERYCGPEAQGFFTAQYSGVTVDPEWFASGDYEVTSAAFECSFYAATLTGLPFGFIGNEKDAPGDDPGASSE